MSFDEQKSIGNRFFKDGDYAAALECYDHCIALQPTNPVAQANRAMALIKLGQLREAMETCELGLQLSGPSQIKEKLNYRLQLAQTLLQRETQNINVAINEVTMLPAEFERL